MFLSRFPSGVIDPSKKCACGEQKTFPFLARERALTKAFRFGKGHGKVSMASTRMEQTRLLAGVIAKRGLQETDRTFLFCSWWPLRANFMVDSYIQQQFPCASYSWQVPALIQTLRTNPNPNLSNKTTKTIKAFPPFPIARKDK